jgi:hypothetical protein
LADRYSVCCKARTGSNLDPNAAELASPALTGPLLCNQHARTKQRPFPHRWLCCPPARPVLRPPPTPSRHPTTSRLHTGYRPSCSALIAARFGRGGPPQFPSPPSERSAPFTPRSPSRLPLQDLHRFHGLHREPPGSALPQCLTTRQASLALRTAQLLPPTGPLTLGFDPTRFQTEPPACYRASWQLPGPDSHRQATTSF